ncbi:MAG: hypothetical protein ACOYXC_06310 [Candidatus Rifleibacteriota bacterium]
MKKIEIDSNKILTLTDDAVSSLSLKLNAKEILQFSVQKRSGEQAIFCLDVIHSNPTDKPHGTPIIEWHTNLQWYEGFDGKLEWT